MSKVDELDARALGALAQNPAMVALMQSKLNSLIGRSSGYVESLPTEVRTRITGLKGIQVEHSKLEARLQEEVLELEKKYFQLFTPLYEKRAKIINGVTEPSEDEVAAGKAKEAELAEEDEEDEEEAAEKAEETQPAANAKPTTGIPEFWLTSMKTNPSLQEIITDEDEAALRQLTDIRMEYLEKPGFKLIFEFSENEFFSEKILTKTYYYREENGYGGDFIYDHAEGCNITWKQNKNLTVRVESKKQRNKSMLSLLVGTKLIANTLG
jgi:nucleosome assembly protein 1-like 1